MFSIHLKFSFEYRPGCEKDVCDGVEEVGEEEVVEGGQEPREALGVPEVTLEVLPDTLGDHRDQEQEVEGGEADQQVVEVALEVLPGEDCDGEGVGEDADDGDSDGGVTADHQVNFG